MSIKVVYHKQDANYRVISASRGEWQVQEYSVHKELPPEWINLGLVKDGQSEALKAMYVHRPLTEAGR